MKLRTVLLLLAAAVGLSGCQAVQSMLFCFPHCQSSARSSSSLVSFLYPRGAEPPKENSVPELHLPVRVGIAFIPETTSRAPAGLEAARRDEMLERIRRRFADRKFVSQIVIIPDYYLQGRSGFDNLEGVQRLYGVDVLALVSYDQVTYRDQNNWSLGYLTIVGAYVLKGNQHDVVTLMDLAVVDPQSRSILLRAGGTDSRRHRTTAADDVREARETQGEGFDAATNDLIEHFDQALSRFEADVREGKANLRVSERQDASGAPRGGAGAFDAVSLAALAGLLGFSCVRRVRRLCPVARRPVSGRLRARLSSRATPER